jgi:uncharacterized membrane protein
VIGEVARRDSTRLMAALALAVSFAPSLLRRSRRDQAAISLAAAGLGAAAGAATEVAVVRVARHLHGDETAARLALAGIGAVATLAELPASPSSAVALLGTTARVAGISALVGSLAPVRARSGVRDPRVVAAGLAAIGAGGWAWRRRIARRRAARPRLTEYPAERWLPTVSYGPESLVARQTLDFEATRFLGTAAGAEEITALRGGAARDPVRVFVGVRSAATIQERCALAVRELERLGAFERARVLVVAATLRGYVNPVVVGAAEHLARGDLATVVVQYHDRRTLLMPAKVPVAARTHRALLLALAGRDDVPEVAVYGESLGAWASQNVFRRGGLAALEALRVRRALWIGTPAFSLLRRAFERGRLPRDERVAMVRTTDLVAGDAPDAERVRFVFLHRATDPVVLFGGLELLWRRPDWLPAAGWRPGITFLQVLADLVRATNWPAALPQALAHDYRLEGPLAVRLALGHLGVPRDEVGRIADHLVAQEVARGSRLRALRSRYHDSR